MLGFVPQTGGLGSKNDELLESFVTQLGAALARVKLASEAQDAKLRVEAEQLKNSVLSSVSHDLRTPLAVIRGTATALASDKLDPVERQELSDTIVQESERLNRLVRNLLDVTRVEAGALRLNKEWQPIEEVVGSALAATESVLGKSSDLRRRTERSRVGLRCRARAAGPHQPPRECC